MCSPTPPPGHPTPSDHLNESCSRPQIRWFKVGFALVGYGMTSVGGGRKFRFSQKRAKSRKCRPKKFYDRPRWVTTNHLQTIEIISGESKSGGIGSWSWFWRGVIFGILLIFGTPSQPLYLTPSYPLAQTTFQIWCCRCADISKYGRRSSESIWLER